MLKTLSDVLLWIAIVTFLSGGILRAISVSDFKSMFLSILYAIANMIIFFK